MSHTTAAPASPPRTRNRAANIALGVVQVVTALAILGAGASTVTGAVQAMAVFDALGAGDWFRYLTGILEIAGALGLLIPRLVGIAAPALAVLWLVAIGTHVLVIGGNPAAAVAFFILTAALTWSRRDRLRDLLPGR
ncbi:MAG TPA: DoxX family protein [Pseudonocardiaceae bacterium]|nr:DoxX family protein [Pseudonocardiaceae bacterium]